MKRPIPPDDPPAGFESDNIGAGDGSLLILIIPVAALVMIIAKALGVF